MKCACCEGVALYRVGHLAYCKKHGNEARRLQVGVIRDMERSNSEFESWQQAIERGQRMKSARFRTHRRHA